MINWFPGHMNKTLKQMQTDSRLCDCFLYVLDARCPLSCINPEFVRVVGGKPIIFILNKSDLVEKAAIEQFKSYLISLGHSCVALNATISGNAKVIISTLKNILRDRIAKNQARNVNFIFRAMVIGIPNSGKSTIVNNLCGKGRAVTGNRAGVTRNKQWVKVDPFIEVMDTPGVLLPNFDDEDKAYNLAITGAVKDEVLYMPDIALRLISKLNTINMHILSSKYNVDYDESTPHIDIINAIAKKRGCIIKGGEIDLERVSKLLIMDFRNGKLGKICLERL